MQQPIRFHTRHIPEEHLDLTAGMGQGVKRNGLCDVLEPDRIERLRAYGIDTVELRLVWWELEPAPGCLDWSRFERDLRKVEAAGLKAGLMAWFNHPPPWYLARSDRAACFKCLRHDAEATTLSPWDPRTLDVMARLYQRTAERYGDRLDFIYMTFSGDYGEPVLPQGVRHYKFSSPHSHPGIFWTGDPFAAADWQRFLREKYNVIGALNDAWATAFADWNAPLLAGITDGPRVNDARRLDYLDWITRSTAAYAAHVYRIIRDCFPSARKGVPIGHTQEAVNGQTKSLCIKALAEVDPAFTARWTGMAVLGDFSRSNVLARRVSSAARFYGAAFGEEAALIIDADNAAAALYEGLANGMSMLHNDIGNIERAGALSRRLMSKLIVDPPRCDLAVYYPVEDEMLAAFDASPDPVPDPFFDQAAAFRARADYEICDSLMIGDGFLDRMRGLVFLTSARIPSRLLPVLRAFAHAGGWMAIRDGADVTVLEDGRRLPSVLGGAALRPAWPEFPEYRQWQSAPADRVTRHAHHVSVFHPDRNDFDVMPCERPSMERETP